MKICFRLISFILCLLPCFCRADLVSETVYLTWQRRPDTTMTIQWLSFADQPSDRLIYRKKTDKQWHAATGLHTSLAPSSLYLIHTVELVDLKPDTDYTFRLDGHEKEYRFRTMPAKLDQPIRFVVGGDMYHDAMTFMEKTCRQAARMEPHFALLGGDIAYAVEKMRSPQKIQRWVEWIRAWSQCMVTPQGRLIPVISAIGNHDIPGQYKQTPIRARTFSLLFPMPGKQIYNVLDFGSYLSIFLLDTEHANPIEGEQTQWLDRTLKQRQHVLHRIAAYHVPAYPSVRSFTGRISTLVRQHWVPLFEKGGIETVFEHHDHAYKRTYPLLNNQRHPEGVVYMGDGAWGIKNPRHMSRFSRWPFYLANFKPVRHFILVTLDDKQTNITTLDDQGQVMDEFLRSSEPVPEDEKILATHLQ